jgi:hypothetical protein
VRVLDLDLVTLGACPGDGADFFSVFSTPAAKAVIKVCALLAVCSYCASDLGPATKPAKRLKRYVGLMVHIVRIAATPIKKGSPRGSAKRTGLASTTARIVTANSR